MEKQLQRSQGTELRAIGERTPFQYDGIHITIKYLISRDSVLIRQEILLKYAMRSYQLPCILLFFLRLDEHSYITVVQLNEKMSAETIDSGVPLSGCMSSCS